MHVGIIWPHVVCMCFDLIFGWLKFEDGVKSHFDGVNATPCHTLNEALGSVLVHCEFPEITPKLAQSQIHLES